MSQINELVSRLFRPILLTDWTYFDLLLLRIRQGRRDDDRNHQECDESKYAVVGTAEDVFQPSHQKRTEEAAQVAQSVDRATCSTGHRGGEEERRDCPKHGSRGLQEGTRQDQAGEREPDFIFESDGKQQAESEPQQGNNNEALALARLIRQSSDGVHADHGAYIGQHGQQAHICNVCLRKVLDYGR